MRPKHLELFAGIGGFTVAAKNAGYDTIGYSEIEPNAIKIYENNHAEVKPLGDIANIEPVKLPDFDLITAGFPCQPFSIANKNKKCDDERLDMFSHIWTITRIKRPKYVLMENVPQFLTLDSGAHMVRLVSLFKEIGYTAYYRIINSKKCVPQKRKRL